MANLTTLNLTSGAPSDTGAISTLDALMNGKTIADIVAAIVAQTISTATTAPGADPGDALIIGGKYNATLPSPSDGQTLGLQLDQKGRLRTAPGFHVGIGQGLTWGNAFGSELTSLAAGNAVMSSVAIDNSTARDKFADVSFLAGATVTTASPNYLSLYLFPLGEDGSTYGDGRFGTSTNAEPPANYLVGSISFAAAASTLIAGVFPQIPLLPGQFKFVLYNNAGTALDATGPTCKYRTYS